MIRESLSFIICIWINIVLFYIIMLIVFGSWMAIRHLRISLFYLTERYLVCGVRTKIIYRTFFLLMHPVGTVLGNAFYSDYLVVLQNVTVNTMLDSGGNLSLHVGKGTFFGAGSSVIGNSNIGDWCTLGVGAILRNRSLPSGYLACKDDDGVLQVKEYDNSKIIQSYFYI